MILKRIDNKAEQIAHLEALLAANPPRPVADKMRADLEAMAKGFLGEQEVAKWINRRYGSGDLYAVIHDLHFSFDGVRIQLDHIVIHRYTCMVYVFETKNAPAGIRQEPDGQWTAGSNRKPILSPLTQVKSAAEVLRRWFDRHYPGLVIEVKPVLVVTRETLIEADPESYIRSDGMEEFSERVFNDWSLFDLVHRLARAKIKGFTLERMTQIGNELVKGHRPITINPASAYGWRPSSSITVEKPSEHDTPPSAHVEIGPGIVLKRNYRGYAIRHEGSQVAKDVIDEIGRRHGEWNDRWQNWIIPTEAVSRVANALRGKIS